MFNKIVGHTSYLGHTGYNNHSREFFTELNKSIPVKIRNYTHVNDLSYLTETQKNMIIHQTWNNKPFEVGKPFNIKPNDNIVNIVLNETNHYYFYHNYEGPKIAYNVWESTRQPDDFFKRLLEYDQLWVPTKWQKECSIEQGYPENRVKVVPEAIDPEIFKPGKPLKKLPEYDDNRFKFLLFGRWDYRKSTTEIIDTFLKTFNKDEPVDLICSIDNPFANDGLDTTQRLKKFWFSDDRIKIKHFVPFNEYISYLRSGHVFVSCARSEGWNLPLCEAIACGIPTISSNFGAQLDFAKGISHLVNINGMERAKLFQHDENTPGEFSSPDFDHLSYTMRDMYENYSEYKKESLDKSKKFRKKWTWENASDIAYGHLEDLYNNSKQVQVNLNPTLTTECEGNKLYIKKLNDGLCVYINGDNKVSYDVCYQDFNNEEYLFKTTIQNNQYVKLFEDAVHQHKNIYTFITSEHGEFFDFVYNAEENTITEINKNTINTDNLTPPIIITGSVGGGTSYITKFLRYCGLFAGKDNCNIQERKTHESKVFKSINENVKTGKFIEEVLDKSTIISVKNDIDSNTDKYKEAFENLFLYRSNTFFGDQQLNSPWGWKAPLLGLTLPIWYKIFPNAKMLSIQKNRSSKQETSKTSAGNWFYSKGDEFTIDTYQNPDIKEQYCPEDTEEIEASYIDYIKNFSTSDMAISLNTAIYLLWTLKKLKPNTVLERGSGFSTFIFEYYKKHYDNNIKIISSDTHTKWLEKTKEFIHKNNLDQPQYHHIDSVPDKKYDFVFEDTKRQKRKDEIGKVLNYIKNHSGYIFFDGFNDHKYIEKRAKNKGMYFCSLKKYTFDVHGRYGCIAGRKNFDPHPSENVLYLDFDKFVSDYHYCNRVLDFCGLNRFKSKQEYIDKLIETKYEAELPSVDDDDIIIVNSYAETETKQNHLYNCISQLKKTGKEILITTHYPIPNKVQNLVDYYICDKRNPLLEHGIYFHHENSDFFYRNNKFGLSTKAYANLLGAQSGIEFAAHKLNKKFFWYLEYDSFIHDKDIQKFIDLKDEIYSKNKVGFIHKVKQIKYEEYADRFRPEDSYSNIFFCFDMSFFVNTFTFPKDKHHYKEITGDFIGTEWYLYDNLNSFEDKFITDESYTTLPLIFENSVFGSCPDGVHQKHYIDVVPEKDTGDPMLFFVVTDFDSGTYIIEKTDFDGNIETIEVPLEYNLHWYSKIENTSHVKVYYEDEEVYSGNVQYEVENSNGMFFLKDNTLKFNTNFIDGPFVEIRGQNESKYAVEFIDDNSSEILHSDIIGIDMWSKSNIKYYKDWKIIVSDKDKNIVYDYKMDLKDKKIYISFESKSLGDTISWMPYVDIFRQKHKCDIHVSTFWNNILDKVYEKISFVLPGTRITNIYAMFKIGCFDDLNKNPNGWQGMPLQKVATDILGLEYKEVKPKINTYKNNINIDKPYICLNEHSTLQAKYWNYPNGWQEIINYYKNKGYEVVVVSKEKTNLNNVIDYTNVSIEEAISVIENCEFVITVASGTAWIAKSLNIPSVIIMGPFNISEFKENCKQVFISDGCTACLDNPKIEFTRNFDFCPYNKNYECTRLITPQMVIEEGNKLC